MGVPTFYRWLCVRYPKIVTEAVEPSAEDDDFLLAKAQEVEGQGGIPASPAPPFFDNLYLDMNGIIHPCCHPEVGEAPASEEDMFTLIFAYVERLLAIVRPRKLLYMAIDGVAPRAKMNQQRARRFKTSAEVEEEEAHYNELKEQFVKEGREIPIAKTHWDSNVITPGTRFLYQVSEALAVYVDKRLSECEEGGLWKGLRVILSDANSPGEGEHKIMSYIRAQRTYPDYDPNLRHCLCGADADLIMLGLATHEPYFTIVREAVVEQSRMRKCTLCGLEGHSASDCTAAASSSEETSKEESSGPLPAPIQYKPLQYLHIHILREYLEKEFLFEDHYNTSPAMMSSHSQNMMYQQQQRQQYYGKYQGGGANKMSFKADLERCIDDFVLMCFFVGNDFLPHLPSLSIHKGSIDQMLLLYQKIRPSLPGYLTDGGKLCCEALRIFTSHLGLVEEAVFHEELKRQARFARQNNNGDTPSNRPGDFSNRPPPPPPDQQRWESQRSKRQHSEIDTSNNTACLLPTPTDDANFAALGALEHLRKRKQGSSNNGTRSEEATSAPAPRPAKMARVESPVTPSDPQSPAVGGGSDVVSRGAGGGGGESISRSEQGSRPKASHSNLAEDIDDFKAQMREMKKSSSELDLALTGSNLGVGHRDEWRTKYYSEKFHLTPDDCDELNRVADKVSASYAEGLQWVLKYYYEGVASWDWYYPFHYAPFASDLATYGLTRPPHKFELGNPFRPFEQLMAVLPPRSSHCLPPSLAQLMAAPCSPIADFYPTKFKEDPDGRRYRWQWVALLPLIDQERLLREVDKTLTDGKTGKSVLTPEEQARNDFHRDRLIVPPSHSLAPQVSAVQEGGSSDGIETSVVLKKVSGGGMAGRLSHSPLGFTPKTHRSGKQYNSYSCEFTSPSLHSHKCYFLPNAIPPPRVLNESDDFDDRSEKERRFNARTAKRIIIASLGRMGLVSKETVDKYCQQRPPPPNARGEGFHRQQQLQYYHTDNRYQMETYGTRRQPY